MIEENRNMIKRESNRRKIRFFIAMVFLLVLVLLLASLSLILGNTSYSLSVVFDVLKGEEIKGATFAIRTLRLPRMLAGLLAGISFGMAGNTFQTMLRNPLASPDIIGVTSGTSVAAVFCIVILQISGPIVSIVSVFCGLFVATLIYILSKGGSFSGGRLILIGIGIQAMLNAVIQFLLLRASQYDVPAAMRWLGGSLNGMVMKDIPGLCIVVLIFGGMIILLGKYLKILELGEQSAITLGLKTNQTRLLLIFSSVFLIAFSTAVTGPISFVAFLSGPIAGRIAGNGTSSAPLSGLVGACLVLGADLIGQFVLGHLGLGTRYPAGVITGILGAPYLIFLLIRMNKRGGAA